MSSAKSLLVVIGLGTAAATAVVACSATPGAGFEILEDGGIPVALPESGPHPDGSLSSDSSDRPPADGATDATADVVTGDAPHDATVDAVVEAGPPDAGGTDAGAEGTPCAMDGVVGKETCGLCGFHTRLCGPTAPGGPAVWQPWGFCQSEVVGGCVPGSMSTEACGKCGTRSRVCQIDCQYAVGACKNEPVNACVPGTKDFQLGLSCPVGGRERTCEATCTYSMFGACFTPGAPTLTVVPTVGTKVKGQFKLVLANAIPRLDAFSTCPAATISASTTTYQYVVIDNPSASTVKVSVWTGQSTNVGSVYIDTIVASYGSETQPANDVARKACVHGVNDDCDDPMADGEACLSSWAGLFGTDAITLAPNSKALVYVAAYFTASQGDYQLTARTDTVTP
jgi:hypothetical protein